MSTVESAPTTFTNMDTVEKALDEANGYRHLLSDNPTDVEVIFAEYREERNKCLDLFCIKLHLHGTSLFNSILSIDLSIHEVNRIIKLINSGINGSIGVNTDIMCNSAADITVQGDVASVEMSCPLGHISVKLLKQTLLAAIIKNPVIYMM